MESLIGSHPAFNEGPRISSVDGLWSEFQACIRLGIDPDIEFAKNRFSRMMNAGGVVADGAIASMRRYDIEKERELKAKRKG